jgi:DNA-binding HxlR family transcriptional regulator
VTQPSTAVPPAAADLPAVPCCPQYHEAIELIGRRWTGAIIAVLLTREPLRFSDIAACVPDLSDRLLSERVKELEQRGLVERRVDPGPPVRVRYALTPMGRDLAPAVGELHAWARRWLSGGPATP